MVICRLVCSCTCSHTFTPYASGWQLATTSKTISSNSPKNDLFITANKWDNNLISYNYAKQIFCQKGKMPFAGFEGHNKEKQPLPAGS
jgi:hypothetical protein